jgi:WXXGXW repeat (2 copies)
MRQWFGLPAVLFAASLACTPPPPVRDPTFEGMWLEAAPPAPLPDVIADPPWAGAIWLAGFWSWSGIDYVWVPGQWEESRPGWRWTPHRWERRGPRWRFVPGRWQPSS